MLILEKATIDEDLSTTCMYGHCHNENAYVIKCFNGSDLNHVISIRLCETHLRELQEKINKVLEADAGSNAHTGS